MANSHLNVTVHLYFPDQPASTVAEVTRQAKTVIVLLEEFGVYRVCVHAGCKHPRFVYNLVDKVEKLADSSNARVGVDWSEHGFSPDGQRAIFEKLDVLGVRPYNIPVEATAGE